MQTSSFATYPRGTLYAMLLDAYSVSEDYVNAHSNDWKEFDDFVYDNLSFMYKYGFISIQDGQPAGFFSFDPRPLPNQAIVGYNCIITACKGQGRGKEQLKTGIAMIKSLSPREIVVSTGCNNLFLPARKMYESVGFTESRRMPYSDPLVPELVEYILIP
jgi:ribosomal protein S18 acetylase RimI-like enzyme